MTSFRIQAFAFLGLALAASSAFRFRSDQPGVDLTRALMSDAADGEFQRFSLLEAAIIAGGVTDPDRVALAAWTFHERAVGALQEPRGKLLDPDRSIAIFDGLHRRFLTGEYRSDYSQPHRTLEEGHFNCVTATILYRCLCQRAGVEVEVAAAKGHVLCRMPNDPPRYIETTCREWHRLNADQKYRRLSDSVELDGLRDLSDVELIGKIFYNRGVAALEMGRFEEAAGLLELACQFDPRDAAAQDNLLATLNNWALAECDAARYEAASRLIHRGFAIDGNYPPLRTNDLHVHQQWVKALCQKNEFAKAIQIIDEVLARRSDADSFRSGKTTVQALWEKSG